MWGQLLNITRNLVRQARAILEQPWVALKCTPLAQLACFHLAGRHHSECFPCHDGIYMPGLYLYICRRMHGGTQLMAQ